MTKANHMKRIETKRLAADITAANLKCYAKIQSLKGYKSAKSSARNRAVAAEWDLHNKILGAKKQVVALYGEDSDEVQAVGLKKKSDWKRSGGRKAKADGLKAA
jgi:hypothetical protein